MVIVGQAGLLVSFMLDGRCTPLIEKHEALKAALAGAGDVRAAVEELEKALAANLDAPREHAGP